MPYPFQNLSKRQDQLARSIAQAFHDTDSLQKYLICCRKYPALAIEQAFKDSKTIPPERLKKSRSAVFFYLVKKHAHQIPKNSRY